MKFIDFFAGIGGFRRGMELAGHECVGFCEFDKFATASYISMHLLTDDQRKALEDIPIKQRQKEILKEEYRNGGWYANDIRRVYAGDIPKADCWCFGFPCQDISVAGKQAGFQGNRSSLFFRVMYLVGQLKEEDKPTYLFIENVKNLLSVNGGWDFARLLIEMDAGGYDAEWQMLNSKDFGVPQNRERVFIIGILRGRCGRKILPITRKGTGNIKQLVGGSQGNRVYATDGVSITLSSGGGGMGAKTGLYLIKPQMGISAARSVLTPERIKKRQNGRRMKEANEPMFTLTSQDRHGVQIDGRIRRLTPKECFRLQGWSDDDFENAKLVNSDNQLYRQAGNGVTVTVIEAIARKMNANLN